MTPVSKYQMDKELRDRMFDIFYQTLADLSTKQEVRAFLFDLLSRSEHIMLSKRLAIALLLIKGEPYRAIRDLLKVSTSTIMSVRYWLDSHGEGYRKAVEQILHKESIEVFVDKVDELIQSVIIPRPGSDWSKIRSEQWQNRMRRKKVRTL